MPPLMGGITRYLREVADETARRGEVVDVHVAGVRRSRRDVLESGVVVHRHREFGRLLSPPFAPGLMIGSGLLGDVVHLHTPNPIGDVGMALRRHGPAL